MVDGGEIMTSALFDSNIKAVAFDLDGTLYPNYRLYCHLFPQFLTQPSLFNAFAAVRSQLHNPDNPDSQHRSGEEFYAKQVSLLASQLNLDEEEARNKLETRIYGKWEGWFHKIKLFPEVKETLSMFRSAGLRLAVLSDFPPRRKIELLGLADFFECLLSTEETGALKPSGIPFAALARSLTLNPENILYVGNNSLFDIQGARSAGMRTALIRRNFLSTGRNHGDGGAEFVFRDYRQLQEYVLK